MNETEEMEIDYRDPDLWLRSGPAKTNDRRRV